MARLPVFLRAKLTVTVSPESIAPFVGVALSEIRTAPTFVMLAAKTRGTNALIRLVPLGVPKPVQRS